MSTWKFIRCSHSVRFRSKCRSQKWGGRHCERVPSKPSKLPLTFTTSPIGTAPSIAVYFATYRRLNKSLRLFRAFNEATPCSRSLSAISTLSKRHQRITLTFWGLESEDFLFEPETSLNINNSRESTTRRQSKNFIVSTNSQRNIGRYDKLFSGIFGIYFCFDNLRTLGLLATFPIAMETTINDGGAARTR